MACGLNTHYIPFKAPRTDSNDIMDLGGVGWEEVELAGQTFSVHREWNPAERDLIWWQNIKGLSGLLTNARPCCQRAATVDGNYCAQLWNRLKEIRHMRAYNVYVYHTHVHINDLTRSIDTHSATPVFVQTQSNDFWTAIKKSLFYLAELQTRSTFHLLTTTHTHSHRSSQTGFPHWSYATAAGANQTPRCPNIPDIPALFQAHKFNLWTHLLACQWPERGIIDSIHLTQVQWALGLANTTAITTLALPDSRKTYVNWLITRFLVSGSLHTGRTAKCENMRKVKRRD